jgi:hypothetical protein
MEATNAVGTNTVRPGCEENEADSQRSTYWTVGRKFLLFIFVVNVCVITGLIVGAGRSGPSTSSNGVAQATRVANLRIRLAALNAAIDNNRRRENTQARQGFMLSDEEYWGQFERNAQEHRDLVLKKAAVEAELEMLTGKQPPVRGG